LDIASRLAAVEEIRQLKARYFRCVDTKDWEQLALVFAPDVKFDRTTGTRLRDPWTGVWNPPLPELPLIVSGRDEVVRMVRAATEDIHTVHHGFMPEIDILSESAALGVWAMSDELRDRDCRLIVRGSGHYHETYERAASGWAIKAVRLTRLSLEFGDGRRPDVWPAATPRGAGE
jgi:hypothetical protein